MIDVKIIRKPKNGRASGAAGATGKGFNIGGIGADWAQRLANVRLLWGQPFNGAADVLGDMTGVGSLTMAGLLSVTGEAMITGLITAPSGIRIGDATITWDAGHGLLYFDKGIYSDGGITALGLGSGSGSGSGGGAIDLYIGDWTDYAEATDGGKAVSGKSGKTLYDLTTANRGNITALLARVSALEGMNFLSDLTLAQSGSGNAVTGVSLSSDKKTITVEKGDNFALSLPNLNHTTMNAVATRGNAIGMAFLDGTSALIDPNGQNGWHHFINMSFVVDSSQSNMWQTQIANKAGTTDLWVRSRAGGSVSDTAAWGAPWTRILTGTNYSAVLNGAYVTLATSQTISGAKTFAQRTRFNGVISAGESADDAYGIVNVCRTSTIENASYFSMVRAGNSVRALGINLNNDLVMGQGNNDKTVTPWMALSASRMEVPRLVSTVGTGTAPLQVSSTTLCTNLNADMLDGYHIGNYQTGGWIKLDAYNPSSATNYARYSHKLFVIDSPVDCILRFRVTTDINYPSYCEWVLRVNWSTNSSMAKCVSLMPAGVNRKGESLTVYIDGDYGVWVQSTAIWNNVFEYRVERGTAPAVLDTVTGTPPDVVQTIQNCGMSRNGVLWGETVLQANAESATKLLTSRKLWGRPFDGTGDVNGDLENVGNVIASGEIKSTAANAFRIAVGDYGVIFRSDGSAFVLLQTAQGNSSGGWNDYRPFRLQFATGLVTIGRVLNVQNEGNVGIGTASPAYKLDVNGTARVTALRIGEAVISWDGTHGALKIDKSVYSDGGITALGAGSASGGGTGAAVDLFIGPWSSYTEAANGGEAVSGKAGKELYDLIQTSAGSLSALTARTAALEGKNYLDELTLAPAGSGNAVTAVALSADKKTLTVTKGTTFLTAITKAMVEAVLTGNITSHTHSQYLTAHQSLANYVTLNTEQFISGKKRFGNECLSVRHDNRCGLIFYSISNSDTDRVAAIEVASSTGAWQANALDFYKSGRLRSRGTFTALSFIKENGTASQVLMADGSVMTKKVLTNLGNVGWDSSGNATSDLIVPTMSFMAYWDGSYNGSTSNLRYCDRGRFGTIVTKNVADYVLSTAYTAADVLSKLKTVDGSGSGLDADTVDGVHLSGLDGRYGRWAHGYKNDATVRYILLGTLPASTSSTWDALHISGTIGGWGNNSKSNIDVYVGRREGAGFYGKVQYMRPDLWDIGVNSEGKVYLILTGRYTMYALLLYAEQATVAWTGTQESAPSDSNFTLLSESANISKFSQAGDFLGNAASATKLQTARAINGTAFDGTGAITTALWGTAREMKITDATGANSGVAVSVNGSAAVALKLPATIAAALSGNASTATRLQGTFSLWGQSFYGNNISGNMTGVGNITAAGEIRVTHTYPNIAVLRACNDNYGVMQRIDSTGYHFLLTDSGNPTGTFNDLRPLSIQLATGMVSLGGDVMTVGDTVTVKNKIILKHSNGKTAELSIDADGVLHVNGTLVAAGSLTALQPA